MVNLNSKLYHTYLSLLGYKKVPLPDCRGVLNSSNNFKYYKESMLHYKSNTILPSGTKVTYKMDDVDVFSKNNTPKMTITIRKSSGELIKSVSELVGKERKIYKK